MRGHHVRQSTSPFLHQYRFSAVLLRSSYSKLPLVLAAVGNHTVGSTGRDLETAEAQPAKGKKAPERGLWTATTKGATALTNFRGRAAHLGRISLLPVREVEFKLPSDSAFGNGGTD